MSTFSASDRAKLTGELYEDLHDVIIEHSTMARFSVAEIVGVLEILKAGILSDVEDAMHKKDDDDEH